MENTWKIHEKTCFTIEEIVKLTGRSSTSIYRYIKNGKLKANKVKGDGKPSYVISVDDVEQCFNIDWKKHGKNMVNAEKNMKKTWENNENEKPLTQETLMETMEKFFSTKQSELVKPMEQQALYKLGKVEQENQFLREKMETILEENSQLREQIKALPGPVESIQQILVENTENLTMLQKEKEELLNRLKEREKELENYISLSLQLESTSQKLHEKEDEMKSIKTMVKREKDEVEIKLLKEKEEALTEAKEAKKRKEELEEIVKQESEEKAMAKAEAEEALKQLKELPAPVESIQQILLDNANNIKALAKEKDNFQSVLKEHEATIKEKERALKELDELRRQELEKLKQEHEKKLKLMSDSAEKEKIEIVEAWKKKTEELERPWWKFW
ncbi:MAG: hypothetical protein ABRQ39_30830 [Candidatus Eremiobacterota bacterium]